MRILHLDTYYVGQSIVVSELFKKITEVPHDHNLHCKSQAIPGALSKPRKVLCQARPTAPSAHSPWFTTVGLWEYFQACTYITKRVCHKQILYIHPPFMQQLFTEHLLCARYCSRATHMRFLPSGLDILIK